MTLYVTPDTLFLVGTRIGRKCYGIRSFFNITIKGSITAIITFYNVFIKIAISIRGIQNEEYWDYLWVIISAMIIFLMQPGFMALETGLTRAKNSINVAIKNMSDFIFSVAAFWFIGFGLMFGHSFHGIIGISDFFVNFEIDDWKAAFFIFQAVFVGTAATIDSGAVAERSKFSTYLIMSFITSAFIYPIFGHWHGEIFIILTIWVGFRNWDFLILPALL